MLDKKIETLIDAHPSGMSPPRIVCERDIGRDIDELVAASLPPMKLAIACDRRTHEAFGAQVFRALKGRFACALVVLDGMPAADERTAEHLRMETLSCDALVAVSSGTINDLCKHVAAQDDKPYIIFPTAASMNGYLSANASITVNGHKKTLPARMPKAVFCDLSVIAAAPLRLSRSGLGDCLARPTAQADWLLAHLLLGIPYDETPFALLAECEPQLFDSARGIAKADPDSIALLVKVLLLSGLGMTLAGGSYPASQGEHMIAHAMEMLNASHDTFHGEAIGVTALTMARLQEQWLRGAPRLRTEEFDEAALAALFGPGVVAEAAPAFALKEERMRKAGAFDWHDVAARIEPVTLSPARLERILKDAGAPTAPALLGWKAQDYDNAVGCARYLRDRFTFLDLAAA